MRKKNVVPLVLLVLVACTPLVPPDRMPGAESHDLFSDANSNRMTADAALRQAQWQEQALTQTALAPIIQITGTAAALSVQNTQAAGMLTAGAHTQAAAMTSTAIWWTPTPNFDSTSTMAVIHAQGTAIANEAIRDNLQLQREIENNEWNRLLGGLTLVFVAGVILVLLVHHLRRTRFQAAHVDARGNVLPVIDVVEGTVTDIDSNPNYKSSTTNDWLVRILAYWVEKRIGVKLLLPEVTAERQDRVKYRDQMLDLATRGLPSPAKSDDARKAKVGELIQSQFSETPQVRVISPDLVRPILTDVLPQIAQDSIEAEIYERKEEGSL